MLASADVTPSLGTPATPSTTPFQPFTCKLCLIDVEDVGEAMALLQCGCQFCIEVSLVSKILKTLEKYEGTVR